MTEKFLCDLAELDEGEIKKIILADDRRLAVYLVDGQVYATDDKCTHGAASLSDTGSLEGTVVECGLHLGAFDIRSGAVMSAPCSKPLQTYPVCIRDQKVWAQVSDSSCSATCGLDKARASIPDIAR